MSDSITVTSSKYDDLLFLSLNADEGLGELFQFHVQFESKHVGIDLTALLGSTMTVTLALNDGFKRHFNGIVCEAAQTDVATVDSLVYAQYSVTLVPTPWLLGQIIDCRIFTDMTVPDIVKQLLEESGYTDVKNALTGNYTAREYCVQYREDCMSFIQRLMEQEGIYYYFTHDANKHTMVLADGVGAHVLGDAFKSVPYAPDADSVLGSEPVVSMFESIRGVDAATVKLKDYNPLTPKAALLGSDNRDGYGPTPQYSEFDYPGTHGVDNVGQHYANVRAEAVTASRSYYCGASSACGVQTGNLFKLTGYPRNELNQEYLITGSNISMYGGGHATDSGAELGFECRFRALASQTPYRMEITTPKPRIVGLQTAIVTGSDSDEDIVVDKYGRVQVNFHWNMPDKPKAKCSCQVRVATPWAGKNWGAVSYPRVGQEVVVSFIEGDPDRPLIVGSVYNAANMPPYDLPGNKTQSGIKSRSLLGTGTDFNELRLEDKKGEEDFFIHAQKDMHEEVENDHTVTIDHDEIITVKHDQTAEIKNDRTHKVDNNDTLNVGKVFKLTAGTEIQLVCGSTSITMKQSGDIEIKGMNITINGSQAVKVEGGMSVDVKAGMNLNMQGTMVKVNADGMLTAQASGMATFKGAMVTVQGSGMTQISGGIVMLG